MPHDGILAFVQSVGMPVHKVGDVGPPRSAGITEKDRKTKKRFRIGVSGCRSARGGNRRPKTPHHGGLKKRAQAHGHY